jgi:GTP cyclohydrolase I
MVTSHMTGSFRDDDKTRREFLAMIGEPGRRGLTNT